VTFCNEFSSCFRTRTHDSTGRAIEYLKGLMQESKKKNMERMVDVVPESDYQAVQQFLSDSPWDERAVLDKVALEVDKLLGGQEDTVLAIDETSFTKKGTKSVGVARQWNGRLGKQDNCQVGVFAALSLGKLATLIDGDLYLPEEWVKDKRRCEKAGVPEALRVKRSKVEIALEMVRRQRELGVRFSWVAADGGYGKDPKFLRGLDDDGETFVVDVHKSQHIYLEDPDPQVPEGKPGRGPKPSKRRAQLKSIRVDSWLEQQSDTDWEQVSLRDSTKGQLRVQMLHQRVWLWDGKEESARCWRLIVRRELDSPKEIKFTLSNAPEQTSYHRLAQMQAQRYWVERSFQDAKSHAGLDHYQARGWRAWRHHVALVLMAMLFMLVQRIEHADDCPLLSCSDIEHLLARFLPRRDTTPDEVLRHMEHRHRQRQDSIDQAYRKQRLRDERAASGQGN
jgi:SRSO17 transposase